MSWEVGNITLEACTKLTVSFSCAGLDIASFVWSGLLESSGNDPGMGQ